MPYLPTLSGILSRDIKIRVPKVDIAGEDRVEQIAPENRVTCIKSGISLDAFYGAGEIGRISVFFRAKNGWYESDTSADENRGDNSWELYVVALIQDSWLNFRRIARLHFFRLNRDWTHLIVARSSDDGAYVILLKTTEISRHSSSLDSFFDLLGDVAFN